MPLAPEPVSPDCVLWALDLRDGNPVLAHRIVNREMLYAKTRYPEEVRVTACGQRLTQNNHPEGWWQLPEGEIPLQLHAVHCGLRDTVVNQMPTREGLLDGPEAV